MFPTLSGAERSRERSRGYRAARIIRITLAVTSFTVGWRKQCLEWFAERDAHFYQAPELSLLMFGFQGYGMFYSPIHMFQGLSRPLSPTPVECTQERAGRTARVAGCLQGLTSRAPGRRCPLHLPTHCSDTPSGFNPQRGVRMDISCVPIMSQAVCFWAPFTDEETEAGRSLMHYPADPETGCASESIKVCSLEGSW